MQDQLDDARALVSTAGVVEVGTLSDARLGALGPTGRVPSGWWATAGDGGGGDRRSAVARHATGAPAASPGPGDGVGPSPRHVRAVRAVLALATSVVTWQHGGGRGAFVVADDVVLVDSLTAAGHDLVLTDVAGAAAMLAIGLDPLDLAGPPGDTRPPTVVASATLVDTAPAAAERCSEVRLARVTPGPPASEVLLTVVGTRAGVQLWRALPDGRTVTTVLDRDGVVAVAVALVTDAPGVAAA